MQKIAIIPISEAGIDIASTLQRQLKAHAIQRTEVGAQWKNFDAFIFIGAMGICVRTIAPYVEDKHTDPAVVCVDSLGMNAISVLSGHIGGANDLTQEVASIIGANPIITTQSDNAGLWALDTLANQFGWTLLFEAPMQDLTLNDCIYRFVNKQPTALYLRARDEGTEYMERTLPEHVTLVSGFDELKKPKDVVLNRDIVGKPRDRIVNYNFIQRAYGRQPNAMEERLLIDGCIVGRVRMSEEMYTRCVMGVR